MDAWKRPFFDSCSRNPIICQQIEIDDTIITPPNTLPNTYKLNQTPSLRLYAINSLGQSILAHVHNFYPYFYVPAPFGYTPEHQDSYKLSLNSALASVLSPKFTQSDPSVLKIECMPKSNIYAYHPNPSLFLKITLRLPSFISSCKKIYRDGFNVPGLGLVSCSQTFESNIPFPLRFMIDTQIQGASWIEIPQDYYHYTLDPISNCQIEIDVDYQHIIAHQPIGEWSKIAPLRILSFDIECSGRKGVFPDPLIDPVIQIANMVTLQGESKPFIKNVFTLLDCANIAGAHTLCFDTETALLEQWQRFVEAVDPDVIIGYNINGFDFPYLLDRAQKLNVRDFPFLGRIKNIKTLSKDTRFSSKAYGTRDSKTINLEGRIQIDMLQVMQRDHKLRSYTLNSVCAHFLGEQKEDVHYSIITDLQNGNDETRRRLAIYCLKDAYLPQRLLDKLMCLVNYMEMARVTGVPFNYLLTRGQQIKVVSQLYRKCLSLDLVIPAMEVEGSDEQYEGATVIDPIKGYYQVPIATLDFTSLYPSIMMAHNLCYSTYLQDKNHAARHELIEGKDYKKTPNNDLFVCPSVRKGVLPTILEDLLSARKKAKSDLKNETDPFKRAVLDGRQLALKISANSVYGFTGATIGKLPLLAISSSVTAYGREMIEKTKKCVEDKYTIENGYKHNAKVIYGDTDSVMVKFGTAEVSEAMDLGREAAAYVTEFFEKPIHLDFEKVYFPYLLINKKRYAGLYWTNPNAYDKLDAKGIETVRRDSCRLVSTVIETSLRILLIDRDSASAVSYVKGVIADLLQNKIDLSNLVISKGLGKADYAVKQAHSELAERMRKRDAGSAPAMGDRVSYVIVKGTKGAAAYEKAEDPIYVLENNLPIDSKYYLENQLSKPLLRIFEPVLGDKASSLLSGDHTRTISVSAPTTGGLMKFAVRRLTCLGCKAPLPPKSTGAVCEYCSEKAPELYCKQIDTTRQLETKFGELWTQCQRCQGSLHQDVICTSQDCPIFYMRKKVQKDMKESVVTLERFDCECHLKTICAPSEEPARITASSWSCNNQKLAVATFDKVIHLYDETGEQKDKFPTKAADPKTRSYFICGLAWSPDSTKLAVAQSDAVVFVYKLGNDWGDKKSICNKFIQSIDVTCLTWPKEQHNSLVMGLSDGKVKIGNLKSNKSATLYQTDSCVISLASNVEGNAVVSGHLDCSLHRFFFDDNSTGAIQGKFAVHSCPPVCLAWGEHVAVSGANQSVVFYNHNGMIMQEFDASSEDSCHEFTVAEVNPSGQSIVFGSFNKLSIFNYNVTNLQWEEITPKSIENFYTVTSLAWKPDGSRLVVGSMCGAIELFDCCLKRSRYKGKFEFNYVSPCSVIVKRLSTGSRIVLKSHYQYEVQKINIFQDQFLVANTPETLLLGDLTSCKLSEIPWRGSGNEKYYFSFPSVCMVFNAGELSLVEYGVNEILGSCRTEYMSPHLISVSINSKKNSESIKKIAYLVDLQTINIMDIVTNNNIATINHDSKIDWLELSSKADKLLFRDKRHQLHLFDILTQKRSTLLNLCSYVQWVPRSDVVVAQSRGDLCIWYSIDSPEKVTTFPIKGEIEDIERVDGRTEVVVDEGVNTVTYTLDEGLIEFGSALDDRDFDRAVTLLESLEITSETEGMWKTLSNTALKERKLLIAERCAAAMGDISRTRYLHGLNEILQDELESGVDSKHYIVRAKLAVLDKKFQIAENIFLEQGKIEEAMEMYQEMHKWDKSIKLAEIKNHPELETLKRNYFQWLIESGQEGKAGDLKADENDYNSAISLYLKGGFSSKAANLLLSNNLEKNIELSERVAASLYKSGMFEKAGEVYEKIQSKERAMDAYKNGKVFRAAIELARSSYPQEVVKLEEQWGDHLVSMKQLDASINHYIEAGASIKAIDAAIESKQWKKAVSIIDGLQSPQIAKSYFTPLASHFSKTLEYQLAEKYYTLSGNPQEAVEMYSKAGLWENAHALATSFMSPKDVSSLYITQAKDLESKKLYKDAERLYLAIGEPDSAINMYKNNKQYDNMIRLVTAHHKDLLLDTHLFLAKSLESEGNFHQAEHHFTEGQDWKSAINMYCANNMFEEAYRVGKTFGGANASKQVAYLWARSLGGEAAVKLLSKFGLLDAALEFATDNNAFEFAFELSRFADKYKINEIHLKHAMFLEDEGKFKDAEKSFILAGKPREAILMYVHNEDWKTALEIAELHDQSSIPDVLAGQALVLFNNNEYSKAEALILRAQKPDIAVKFYKESNQWNEALRFAKEYMPNKLAEIKQEYERSLSGTGSIGKDEIIRMAKLYEQQKDYIQAIEIYLKLNISHSNDLDFLEEQWEYAVKIAVKFLPERLSEVARLACTRLIEIKRFESAGVMYSAVEMFKESIDAYILGNLWDNAREVLKKAPKYGEYFEAMLSKQGKSTATRSDAPASSEISASIETYAQRGEWEKCIELAAAQKSESLENYLTMYCSQLFKDGKIEQAIRIFAKYGTPASSTNFEMYDSISKDILRKGNNDSISVLKDMLYKLVFGSGSKSIPPQFEKYLFICHLKIMKSKCSKNNELKSLAAKQAISLLRYCKDIRPDLAFCEAGEAAKIAGMTNMAFVCWNRYLDISDAIEEGDASLLENTDFMNTDIPFDFDLPKDNLSEKKREEIRDWVLEISLDQKVNQEIDHRNCNQCNESIYEASLSCYNCKTIDQPCIITGYPVVRNGVKCSKCHKSANREDWNKLISIEKKCPWCNSTQSPIYFGK